MSSVPTLTSPPFPPSHSKNQILIMHSYFLPYPKGTKHKPPPLEPQTAKPYPHPQPDPDPNNPPSPLNLSPSSPSTTLSSSDSSSGSSTIKPARKKHVHWKQDYHPSILKLKIVCGDPEDPSLVVVFGLRFREGKRPKVRFSVKRGHGKTRELGDENLGDEGEHKGGDDEMKHDNETRGRKRKRQGRD